MLVFLGRRLRGFAAIVLALVLFVPPAVPHTHVDADGTTVKWYPAECCHDRDCRPVARVQSARNGLWLTTVDGFTVLIGPNQARRPSQDTRWHVCLGGDDLDPSATETITCVFEPPHS